MATALHKIHPVAGTNVHTQLRNAFAHWFDIAKVSRRNTIDSASNRHFGTNVTQSIKPALEGWGELNRKHGSLYLYRYFLVLEIPCVARKYLASTQAFTIPTHPPASSSAPPHPHPSPSSAPIRAASRPAICWSRPCPSCCPDR